jgi:hypothetical protein
VFQCVVSKALPPIEEPPTSWEGEWVEERRVAGGRMSGEEIYDA